MGTPSALVKRRQARTQLYLTVASVSREAEQLRVGLFTREYPPQVYGGAGVHVDYLSRELAKQIEVEVHCWGPQRSDNGNLHVRGDEPWSEITDGTEAKFKGALEALSLNLTQIKALEGIDIVHTHTWYVSMAGYLARKLYGVPFVLTTHSLEPLRAWKAEQLGSGYAMSSWMERTAILDADAVIAVSAGTKADIQRAYPEVAADRIHVIYNGIDLAEYQKTSTTKALTDYGVDPSVPYVLFVGRITRQKGVTHFVDAIRSIPLRSLKKCAPKSRPRARIIPASSGSKRWSHGRRQSSSTAIAASSAAPPFTSHSASSILKRWPAVRRLLPAPQAAFSRLSSMVRRAIWSLSSRTRLPAFLGTRKHLQGISRPASTNSLKILRNAGASVMLDGIASKTSSVGLRSRTKQSTYTHS
jgi:Glycosyltransferase Family 4